MKLIPLGLFIGLIVIFSTISLSHSEEKIEVDDATASSASDKKVKYVRPSVKGDHHFIETFDVDSIGTKWIKSKAKKDDVDESIAKYEGEWLIESSSDSVMEGDKGLVLKSKAKHHAISSRLVKPFHFTNKKPLIIQYEVKFQLPLECGGAYVKLLSDDPSLSLENLYDKTGFSIMFGPDKCGGESKYHFIIRYKNPVTGTYEEKHVKKTEMLDTYFSDGKTHLYTLIIETDNTYKMMIDLTEVNSGHLLKDFQPPINPPKEIVDPNDKKPSNWDDRDKIPDPDAVKPEDWDENEPKQIIDENAKMPEGWLENESETISDSSAVKPEDWDDATDGEWEAPKLDNPKCKNAPGCGKWNPPMIENPKYKGKWKAPLIENPSYQGIWEPRKIANPEYFEENDPFTTLTSFSAIGLELWSMTENIYFDNFLITDDKSVAEQFAKDSWALKKSLETINSRSSDSVIDGLINAANEKPWLWALYLLVILLPIVIIAVFCCGKSPSKTASAAASKKTDEAQPDDDEATQNQEQEEADQNEDNNENDVEEENEEVMTKSTVIQDNDEGEASNNATPSESPRKVKKRTTRKD